MAETEFNMIGFDFMENTITLDAEDYFKSGSSLTFGTKFIKSDSSVSTDKLSVEKLQEELDSCIHTLIHISAAASIQQNIVEGNFADTKLAKLAKTHKLAADYIEKTTGRKIDDVLAENEAIEKGENNEI